MKICSAWFYRITIAIIGVTVLLACEKKPESTIEKYIQKASQAYIETGDLEEIKKRGKLRVLLTGLSADVAYLPRRGLPIHFETEMLARLAGQLGVEPVWIYVDKFEQLMPKLLAGEGDLIAANYTVTDARKEKLIFSVPVTTVREQLLVNANSSINELSDLKNIKLALQESTSYWETIESLKKQHDYITIQKISESLSMEQIVDHVSSGQFAATVVDSNYISAILPLQNNLKIAFDVSGDRAISWGMRPNAVELKAEVDRFITNENLTTQKLKRYKADLPEIKQKKVLRVLTRNNAVTYFLWRGELMGFEYELIKKFADSQGLRLEMIVAPNRKELATWLRQGRGDLIAASLTIHDEEKLSDLRFSRPYNFASEVMVTRSDDDSIKSLEDLSGRNVYVRPSGSYWKTLTNLINSGIKLKLEAVPEKYETEDIIEKVADGDYDLTVADSHLMAVELAWRDDVKNVLTLKEEIGHGWLVREDSQQLLDALNAFIKKEYKGLFYNITRNKYFDRVRSIKKRLQERIDRVDGQSLSPYDAIVKEVADRYEFDWRLIVSQMYQESRFDPKAESWVGAQGLLQVMPRTAKELGIDDVEKPRNGIEAGVKYMNWLRDRFEPELSVQDRMWFILASYNAGAGHVKDARRLAEKMGWEPKRWFGHVEKAMLLLSQRKYAKKARYGYVRGSEPVKYVRQIRDRYNAYLKLSVQAANM